MDLSLRDLHLPTFMDTSSSDLITGFFVPALERATYYDRAVGFFTSGWLRLAARGMVSFAGNGGRARWVTSPILDSDDWGALLEGSTAREDEMLRASLVRSIDELEEALDETTRSALAWLVADTVIDFRLALPRNKLERGEFHDKFGVFGDVDSNWISFNGSYNDSIQGSRNYESIKIFPSWDSAYRDLVAADKSRFERLWRNEDPNVRVLKLPEACRANIVRLRRPGRPYRGPDWSDADDCSPSTAVSVVLEPHIPEAVKLRDYQSQAIDAWFEANCCGFFEMATGTGKTITALAAAAKLFEREGRLAVVIAVPYQHLVDQWHRDAQRFGFSSILAYKSFAAWTEDLQQQIAEFTGTWSRIVSVIVTHATFTSQKFRSMIKDVTGPALLIADEAHHLGSETGQASYPESFGFRLALSATPERWFDDSGTSALRAYFGPTVFDYPLERAIGTWLTPYYYYPRPVELTDEEMEEYLKLSERVAKLYFLADGEEDRALQILLFKRADLLNNASQKLDALSTLIDIQPEVHHALFYCAPPQVDPVLHMLGHKKNLLAHKFTAEENTSERQELLQEFASGQLDALVAMKCLDEGVDVPATRMAFILASSSNPREFIQRRGRILRRSDGKEFAVIHDLLTLPPAKAVGDQSDPVSQVEKNLMKRELARFAEFSEHAINKHVAIDSIWNIAKAYGVMDF